MCNVWHNLQWSVFGRSGRSYWYIVLLIDRDIPFSLLYYVYSNYIELSIYTYYSCSCQSKIIATVLVQLRDP
jgi:hypothetical protein